MFDVFDLGGVGVVGGFGLKRWQGDAAAADGGCARGVQDIAADRADIEFGTQQVGGAVHIRDGFTREQLRHRDMQCGGKGLQQGNIGQPAGSFPF